MNRLHQLWVFVLLGMLIAPMAQAGYQIQVTVNKASTGAASSISGIQCSSNSDALGLDSSGQLHVRPAGSGKDVNKPAGNFTAIACYGSYYALDSSGQLWHWTASTPAAVYDTGVKTLYPFFYVRNDGSAFRLYDKKTIVLPEGETIRIANRFGLIVTNSNKLYRLSSIDADHYGFTLLASDVIDGVRYHWGSSAADLYLWLKADGTLGGYVAPGIASACTGASRMAIGYNLSGYLMCFFADGAVKTVGSLYWKDTTIKSTAVPSGSKVVGSGIWPTVKTPDNRILVVYPTSTFEIFDFSAP